MNKLTSKIGLVVVFGASLMITACGSKSANFVEKCAPNLMEEGLGELAAKGACECAYERLAKSMDGKQLTLATKLIGMSSSEAREHVRNAPDSADVLEAAEGAMKSCAT